MALGTRLPELSWADFLTIAVYFIVVLIVGLWATFRPNRDSSEGYFLAGKQMTWFPVGASLFATNCGAQMFIGMAGSAAASGLSVAVYELHIHAITQFAFTQAVYLLIFFGWIANPVYTACGAYTVPQYVRRRFHSRRLQATLASVVISTYICNLIASQIFTGTLILKNILGWNTYISIFAILTVTTVYTIVGGLTAVMYTDALQTFIYLTGAFIVLIKSLQMIGGWEDLVRKFLVAASNVTNEKTERYECGLPPTDAFHIWRPASDPKTPWTGAVSGLTLMGMGYWCFDQVEVQRGLSAKSITHAKAGALLCGFFKICAAILFIVPGMISRALYPEIVACAQPELCEEICENASGCWNIAYIQLVVKLLPSGLQGMMLAAILAAVMSTLTSVFNSASALFTIDVWKNVRPRATNKEIMMVSRTCILALMGLSILWLPVLELAPSGQLWEVIQRVAAYCNTPCATVLLFSIFWKRTSEAGAFWGLVTGILLGVSRLCLDWVYQGPFCGSGQPDTRPALIAKVNYLHYAAIVGVITSGVIIVVSLKTKPIPEEQLHRLTWWTCHSREFPDFHDRDDDTPATTTIAPVHRRKLTRLEKFNEIVFVWICGLTDCPEEQLSSEEELRIQRQQTSLKEERVWSNVVNVLAVFIAVVTTAIIGFFA